MTTDTLTTAQIAALPYEIDTDIDGHYTIRVDHDGHADDADDCAECEEALASIRQALPQGWGAEWTGDGNGTESDVAVTYRGDEGA